MAKEEGLLFVAATEAAVNQILEKNVYDKFFPLTYVLGLTIFFGLAFGYLGTELYNFLLGKGYLNHFFKRVAALLVIVAAYVLIAWLIWSFFGLVKAFS